MGGIFSCVRDLARWIAGFTGVFPPGSARAAGFDHPLSTPSRREMQLGQVALTDERSAVVARLSGPASLSYGFGLFAEDDPAFGTIVQHSGGYPGFGSQMRWHPASGLGTVVLANGTYAPAGALAGELLSALLTAQIKQDRERGGYQVRGPLPGAEPWPATVTARAAVTDLLAAWNADDAARIFAPNIELDRSLAQRQADIEKLRERIGAFATDPGRPAEFDSPAHCRWWLTGPAGTVAVQIKLAPLRQPLVQELAIAIPAARGSALAEALDQVIGAVNAAVPRWPASLRTADGFDADHGERQLRVAAAWAGACALDCYLAGNGDTSATARLTGATGSVVLALEIGESGLLRRSEVTLLG